MEDSTRYLSDPNLQARLIALLPDIAEHLPTPDTQTTTVITGDATDNALNSLVSFITGALALFKEGKGQEAE